jgi:hypothetical protein
MTARLHVGNRTDNFVANRPLDEFIGGAAVLMGVEAPEDYKEVHVNGVEADSWGVEVFDGDDVVLIKHQAEEVSTNQTVDPELMAELKKAIEELSEVGEKLATIKAAADDLYDSVSDCMRRVDSTVETINPLISRKET